MVLKTKLQDGNDHTIAEAEKDDDPAPSWWPRHWTAYQKMNSDIYGQWWICWLFIEPEKKGILENQNSLKILEVDIKQENVFIKGYLSQTIELNFYRVFWYVESTVCNTANFLAIQILTIFINKWQFPPFNSHFIESITGL